MRGPVATRGGLPRLGFEFSALRLRHLSTIAILVFCTTFFLFGGTGLAQTDDPWIVQSTGGAAGGPVAMLRNGDIQQVRNIQFGFCDDQGCDPNGDIGAGGDGQPGHGPRGRLSANFDVGQDMIIYDGHKHPLVRFGPGRRITMYVKPRVRAPISPTP